WSWVEEDRSIVEYDMTGVHSLNDADLAFTPSMLEVDPVTINVYAYSGNGQIDASDWDSGILVGTAALTSADSGMTYVLDLDETLINPLLDDGQYLGLRFDLVETLPFAELGASHSSQIGVFMDLSAVELQMQFGG
ncbi:MAG TPA: hypothetical protein VF552_01170, partial [Allosphingosinicella sp.]